MKKYFIHIFIFSMTLLMSCSGDNADFLESNTINNGNDADSNEEEPSVPEYDENSNVVIMSKVMHEEGWKEEPNITRTIFDYDYIGGQMKFEWQVNDIIDVYPVKTPDAIAPENSAKNNWVINRIDDSVTGTSSVGIFDADDENIASYPGHEYVAVYPHTTTHETNYTNIPVKYSDQKQEATAKMGLYAKSKKKAPYTSTSDDAAATALAEYIASETRATLHLKERDYLVDQREANIAGHMQFKMHRMGSIVRFYLLAPSTEVVYDSLQLYNSKKLFMQEGTMNASAKTFTPTKERHSIVLKFGDNGFDYSGCTENDEYYYSASYKWLIIAYMMMAPIDLSADDTPNCVLYLHSHKKSDNEHLVYKVTLSKKKINRDFLYQWSAALKPDEPIAFEPISVEEWKEGTTFSNGDDGKGTEGW